MEPIIPDDCFILVVKWLLIFPIKPEQRLVINHPNYGVIVKTVAIVDRNGFIWSKGESFNSLSVEELGPVDKSQLLGRVIGIFTPKKRN
ncbi:hypothetical protein GCM10011501_27050 [Thalassotalea profundi]|uniref:Nickel-type superoxide dismutase maturation protease n=2 Tax=Thalassotalea profundi TaxID=2036687 RepID=A0ABQ3IWY7_9GAMM|nr:hypothetical protein GCM10011501_27050 [Thalassotalea profundi]